MRRILPIILLVLFPLAVRPLIAQGWEILDSGTGRTLIDVVFVNDSTGWAIGDTSLILYTEDGGMTWTEQACPVQDTRFEKAQFLSEQVGYIIGHGGGDPFHKEWGQSLGSRYDLE